jgi:hypothetical protein
MKKLKQFIADSRILSAIAGPVYDLITRKGSFRSGKYWEDRYASGGDSGFGSYGDLAEKKAGFINQFVDAKDIRTVIEFGCGDGNQLSLFDFDRYIGLDVARHSILKCSSRYAGDRAKSFFLYDPMCFTDHSGIYLSELALSLDVIYHIVEDDIFEKYMHDLFGCSSAYVIIYSSDFNDRSRLQALHVKHRKFTEWVSANIDGWSLVQRGESGKSADDFRAAESSADFYVYRKDE